MKTALGVLLCYLLVGLFLFVDSEWHQDWDSGIYLLTARSLANNQGYVWLNQPLFLRPPGFSYFLSWLVTREGDFNFHTLNLIIMGLAVASLATVYLLMRRVHGPAIGLGITLLTGTSALFIGGFNLIMSDYLFISLLFFGIWIAVDDGPDYSATRIIAGSFIIAAAIYVRFVGIVVVPGLILLSLKNHKGRRRLTGFAQAAIIVALLVPWLQWSSRGAAAAPRPATQLWAFSYSTAVFNRDPGDPSSPRVTLADWKARLWSNSGQLAKDVGLTILHSTGRFWAVVASLIVSAGFLLAVRGGWSVLEWLFGTYAAVVLFYYTYDQRLILPLVPLIYSYLFIAIRQIPGKLRVDVPLALCVALLCLNLMYFSSHFDRTTSGRLGAVGSQMHQTTAAWIKAHTPSDAVILHRFPPILSVLTGRRVYGYFYLRGQPLPQVDYAVFSDERTGYEAELASGSIDRWVLSNEISDVRIYRVR